MKRSRVRHLKTTRNCNNKETSDLRIGLVGQPNCGKSTIFNEVAGYRSVASNFPGATVTYTKSRVRILGKSYELVDLPGIYSLTSLDPATTESQRYLLSQKVDVIINVMDASILSRSLELTLQLLDLEIPMVVCLNMIDEAERKGIRIDANKLSKILGTPVFTSIASRGIGIQDLFQSTLKTAKCGKIGHHIRGNRDVERIIALLSRLLKQSLKNEITFSKHLLATKLLEHDHFFENMVYKIKPELEGTVNRFRKVLSQSRGRSSDVVINEERHGLSMSLFEKVAQITRPQFQWKDQIDNLLMHNFWGYIFLIGILFSFFYLVFYIGGLVERPLLDLFNQVGEMVYHAEMTNRSSLWTMILKGIIDGIGGGVAIVLPYLLPFLLGLSFLEDVGYLPRVAFLLDGFMHRLGLHGTAVIPFVLGYGCNVPAVMATRIMESPRDRFIGSLLVSLVPCAARMTIIFGLVGYYIGGIAAFSLYFINLAVIALVGSIFSKLMKEETPGMMMEIPVYHFPRLKTVFTKSWLRIKEFIVIAWPLLLIGSIILSLIEAFQLTDSVNTLVSPVTMILGLPKEVGTTLIFGILRKELSMLMLFQALGTNDVLNVMTVGQVLTFTVFVIFYIPCMATMGVLVKQVRVRGMIIITNCTFIIALIMGILMRGVGELIW